MFIGLDGVPTGCGWDVKDSIGKRLVGPDPALALLWRQDSGTNRLIWAPELDLVPIHWVIGTGRPRAVELDLREGSEADSVP